MTKISENIREIVITAKPQFLKIPPESARRKASPEAWSNQEIVGHLIDSALNNHQRFVRGVLNTAENFPPYDQNGWVEVQSYNTRNWMDLVDFWVQCNTHLCGILDAMPEGALDNLCNIGKEKPVTIGFVVEDYLRHLKLHVGQILETI